jgi:hypothetical protein
MEAILRLAVPLISHDEEESLPEDMLGTFSSFDFFERSGTGRIPINFYCFGFRTGSDLFDIKLKVPSHQIRLG